VLARGPEQLVVVVRVVQQEVAMQHVVHHSHVTLYAPALIFVDSVPLTYTIVVARIALLVKIFCTMQHAKKKFCTR
jgi:hypothetical protein